PVLLLVLVLAALPVLLLVLPLLALTGSLALSLLPLLILTLTLPLLALLTLLALTLTLTLTLALALALLLVLLLLAAAQRHLEVDASVFETGVFAQRLLVRLDRFVELVVRHLHVAAVELCGAADVRILRAHRGLFEVFERALGQLLFLLGVLRRVGLLE